eukprot:135142_1
MEVNTELTDKKFVVNLINTCIGLGILSMPFAFAISQYYAIISMSIAFFITIYAAYCIVKVTLCSYDLYGPTPTKQTNNNSDTEQTLETDELHQTDTCVLTQTVHIDDTDTNKPNNTLRYKSVYTIISYKALGICGAIYGTFGIIFLYTIFLINILVMNWKLLHGIINSFTHNYNSDLIYLYIIIASLPLMFVLNWKSLTIVGWIGVISVTITTIIIFSLFVKSQIDFTDNKGTIPVSYFSGIDEMNTSKYSQDNMDDIAVVFFSFLTFVSGLAGNGVIGMMVISAENKNIKHITKLIFISYSIVAIYYIFIGVIGQHVFGAVTHVLVLNNLFFWPENDITCIIVSIIMILNLFASFGIICGVDADVIQGIIKVKNNEKYKKNYHKIISVNSQWFNWIFCKR